jgi:secreted trypsin-like serine protease
MTLLHKTLLSITCIAGLSFAHHASAVIYKIIDADGRVTYTNVPTKGAQKLDIGSTPSNGANSTPANTKIPTPASFPRVDKQTQSTRDDKRREILQAELATEQQALEQARQAYTEGESVPEVYKGANGKTYRNVAKFDEKMKRLKADVDTHQRNIELLEKELQSLN